MYISSGVSEVQPNGGIADNADIGHHAPHVLVGGVACGRDLEVRQLINRGHGGQNLSSVLIEVNLVQHELGGLLLIRKTTHQANIVGTHRVVRLQSRAVRQRILVVSITTVEDSLNCTGSSQ